MGENDERVFLTVEQAVAMLPDKDYIHTFLNPNGFLIGADWSKEQVMEGLKNAPEKGIELTGALATRMGHGLCFQDKRGGEWKTVFVETKEHCVAQENQTHENPTS